ncbi:hypothetical protein GPECTOR_13g639 [Gonium pectorale]|uniref:Uncharacterized protein n=1 Tax=Gonium pectorale TaxID=33097 RepID=A0A150GN46_GONPE|nr:hypothetical protein GPECTOR_13g639 [Gonium pectorale]|eukprot:KXZ51152.1 hypothetical protein GPECTOR_13g639 [Gonium pectorale]
MNNEYWRQFAEALGAPHLHGRRVLVVSSPFSRTMRTAALAAEAAGISQESNPVQIAPELRERFFGEELELQPYGAAYGKIWEHDAQTSSHRPGGNGESVDEVSARLRLLFQRLEAEHKGAVILLVSHGDTLSILQSTMLGQDTRHHRRFAFNTAELRPLHANLALNGLTTQ